MRFKRAKPFCAFLEKRSSSRAFFGAGILCVVSPNARTLYLVYIDPLNLFQLFPSPPAPHIRVSHRTQDVGVNFDSPETRGVAQAASAR